MISTSPVGTVLQWQNGICQYVIKCSTRGEADGFVEVIVLVGKDLYTVLQAPTEQFTVLPNQVQYAATPLVRHFREFLRDGYPKNIATIKAGRSEAAVHTYKEAYGKSDGSTASYYQLPPNSTELQDLISHRNMNAQMGEIFRATYRFGMASHSDQLRDAKKIKFYIEAEIKRLESQCNK